MSFSRATSARKTSWERVAPWYQQHLKQDDFLQRLLIIPGVLRLLETPPGATHLDIACGEGGFTRQLAERFPRTTIMGLDAAPSLIRQAQQRAPRSANYVVADARRFQTLLAPQSIDQASCILALQNIDPCEDVFHELAAVLKTGGKAVFVLNHPCFRQPRQSGWGWDEERKIQYRRVDRYLSSYEMPIQAHPGSAPDVNTFSYHHALSFYVAAFAKAGFMLDALEEWTSPKVSDSGPKAKAENIARTEIPLFLAMRVVKTR